jgi:sugar/nucleoside kinase (ribokinase family)
VIVLQDERDLDLPAGLCLAMTQPDGERSVAISRDPSGHTTGAPLALRSLKAT